MFIPYKFLLIRVILLSAAENLMKRLPGKLPGPRRIFVIVKK